MPSPFTMESALVRASTVPLLYEQDVHVRPILFMEEEEEKNPHRERVLYISHP